jgi:hypothetical protein
MKIKVALASAPQNKPDFFYWVPEKERLIHVFKVPVAWGIDYPSDSYILVPHQERDSDNGGDIAYLSKQSFVGWDWQPEKLRRLRLGNVLVFVTSPYHKLPEIEQRLAGTGRTLKTIHIEPAEFENAAKYRYAMPVKEHVPYTKEQAYVSKDPKTLYPRTRFLWKMHHTKFNDYDTKFVKNIGEQLSKGKTLTKAQDDYLHKLFAKYKVPMDAVAATLVPDFDENFESDVQTYLDMFGDVTASMTRITKHELADKFRSPPRVKSIYRAVIMTEEDLKKFDRSGRLKGRVNGFDGRKGKQLPYSLDPHIALNAVKDLESGEAIAVFKKELRPADFVLDFSKLVDTFKIKTTQAQEKEVWMSATDYYTSFGKEELIAKQGF